MKTRNTLNWIGMTVGVLAGLMWIALGLTQVAQQRDPQYFMLGIPGIIVILLSIFGRRAVAGASAALIVGLLMTASAAGIPFTAKGNVSRDSGWLGYVLVFAAPLLFCGALFVIAHVLSKSTRQRALLRLALSIGALSGAMWIVLGIWGLATQVPAEDLRGEDATILALGACILVLTLLSRFRPMLGMILLIAFAAGWVPFWLQVPSLPPDPQRGLFGVIAGLVLWAIFSLPLAVTAFLFTKAATLARSPDVPAPIERPAGG